MFWGKLLGWCKDHTKELAQIVRDGRLALWDPVTSTSKTYNAGDVMYAMAAMRKNKDPNVWAEYEATVRDTILGLFIRLEQVMEEDEASERRAQ